MRNETAEEIRSKLDSLILHNNTTVSSCINKFLTLVSELNRIPGEKASSNNSIYLFLKNITDVDYGTIIMFLKNGNPTLKECVTTIRRTERELSTKKSKRKKLQNIVRRQGSRRKRRRYDESDEEIDNGYSSSLRN